MTNAFEIPGDEFNATVTKAADEIERLRALNAELLAALKGMVAVADNVARRSGWADRGEIAASRAAIAKAEGRS